MNNEYISKEYIRTITLERWSNSCGAESYAYSRVLEDIEEADVVELKHGHWQPHWCDAYCSVCGYLHKSDGFGSQRENYPYCPQCGSKMD